MSLNHRNQLILQTLVLLAIWSRLCDSLIITSVLAGDKKFKTISFDHKFLKPLTFETEMPNTEFHRYRIIRPPKFDIDVNIPIKLPLEEEYPQEEYRKPVTSHISLQTGEITEPSYGKQKGYGEQKYQQHQQPQQQQYYEQNEQQKSYAPDYQQHKSPTVYKDEIARASSNQQVQRVPAPMQMMYPQQQAIGQSQSLNMMPLNQQPQLKQEYPNARSDLKEQHQQVKVENQEQLVQSASYNNNKYAAQKPYQNNYQDPGPEFIPGGFVNLQLSGPTGGPKPTYEDYDREKWNQKLSQTLGAMPYPILNYHQLQNYYGGLGTFTNGLPDTPYESHSLIEKLKSSITQVTSKLHMG